MTTPNEQQVPKWFDGIARELLVAGYDRPYPTKAKEAVKDAWLAYQNSPDAKRLRELEAVSTMPALIAERQAVLQALKESDQRVTDLDIALQQMTTLANDEATLRMGADAALAECRKAIKEIVEIKAEFFFDGLEADLAEAEITQLPAAYREGYADGVSQAQEFADRALSLTDEPAERYEARIREAKIDALEEAATEMNDILKNDCLCHEVPQWLRTRALALALRASPAKSEKEKA